MTSSKILQQASSLFWLIFLCLLCYTTTNAQNKYTGEELFRAVYFGQGNFAEQVAELQGMSIENFTSDAQEIREANQFQDQIVAYIKTQKPDFFDQFSNALHSGNHVKVRNQLQNGKSTLYWAGGQLGETRDLDAEAELADAVAAELGGAKVSSDALRSAVENHLASKDGSDSVYAERKYIRYVAFVFIIVVIEWYFDPDEEFSATYQDKLVNSLVKKL
jgi:SdpC family antimicrobial peptide